MAVDQHFFLSSKAIWNAPTKRGWAQINREKKATYTKYLTSSGRSVQILYSAYQLVRHFAVTMAISFNTLIIIVFGERSKSPSASLSFVKRSRQFSSGDFCWLIVNFGAPLPNEYGDIENLAKWNISEGNQSSGDRNRAEFVERKRLFYPSVQRCPFSSRRMDRNSISNK